MQYFNLKNNDLINVFNSKFEEYEKNTEKQILEF